MRKPIMVRMLNLNRVHLAYRGDFITFCGLRRNMELFEDQLDHLDEDQVKKMQTCHTCFDRNITGEGTQD